MLKNHDSSAVVAVSDIARARSFYGDTLGLEVEDESMEGVLTFRTGSTRLIVYVSDEAGTNRANALVWDVSEELDTIVAALEAKQVVFEHYPGIGELQGNVHVGGGMKLVWLKDPDGNVLHLMSPGGSEPEA
jgi:catechol 2,3-dioxygenase-like lactoylglutathione lyase family enzyme